MTTTTRLSALLLLVAACARSSGPLPGDSVAADGAVTLSPPRLSTAPHEVREARELGAIESRLFPPELVMEHQNELSITDAQKEAISKEVAEGQKEMLHLQWALSGDKEKLVKLLDPARVDEAKVSEAAARVMENETRVKTSHLRMLVRVKNVLTPGQQERLRAMREAARAPASATEARPDASDGH